MKVPNASGVDTRRITPCSEKLRCTAGSCKALLMAARMRAMISLGVLAGARMPHQDSASTGMPDSLNVGVSGSCGKRLAEVTASGRNALAPAVEALQRATRTVPIVFVTVTDQGRP